MPKSSILVAGAGGRMGKAVVAEVLKTPGATLAGGFERPGGPDIGKDIGVLAGLDAHVSSYGIRIQRLGNFVIGIDEEDADNLKGLYTDAAYLKTVGGVDSYQRFAAGKAMLGAGEGMAQGGGAGGEEQRRHRAEHSTGRRGPPPGHRPIRAHRDPIGVSRRIGVGAPSKPRASPSIAR